jgi:nucleotide-binding universal stress UspA family protein
LSSGPFLVATDFSPAAEAALAHAAALASRTGARLCIGHVAVQEPLLPGEEELTPAWGDLLARRLRSARARLDAIERSLGGPLRVATVVTDADSAARGVMDLARELGAEAIVLGTHGRSGLARALLGSVAEGVIRSAPCAVLAVKEGSPVPYRSVLAATDFSDPSRAALGLAARVAQLFDARFSVAHVVEVRMAPAELVGLPVRLEDPAAAAARAAADLDRLVGDFAAPVETFLRHGDPAAELAGLVAEKKPDLLVMATHGRTGLGRLLQGSVAEEVIRATVCAVLTCRTPDGCRMPSLDGPFPPEAA